MATRTMRFDMLTLDDVFQFDASNPAVGVPGVPYRKTSTMKAAPATLNGEPLDREWAVKHRMEFRVKPSAVVTVHVPDPTPEELESRRLERARFTLERFVRVGTEAVAKFRATLDGNACYAFENAEGAMEWAAQLHVGLVLQTILNTEGEHGGLGPTVEFARREVLRGARWPRRSTSPVSNFMEQAKVAAYGEFLMEVDR